MATAEPGDLQGSTAPCWPSGFASLWAAANQQLQLSVIAQRACHCQQPPIRRPCQPQAVQDVFEAGLQGGQAQEGL